MVFSTECCPNDDFVREHKASIGCVAADREMLVTGDEDGNVFVRDFEPAHLGQ